MSTKPSTREEILSLPIGPEIGYATIIYSEENKKNGYIIYNNDIIKINPKASKMNISIIRETILHFIEDNEILFVRDDEGEMWSLGKYADGSWFRQRGFSF